MKEIRILTNDPSMTAWGWVVVTLSGEIVEAGCIKTEPDNKKKNIRKTNDALRRISEINKILVSLVKEYDIQFIVSEIPHGSQSAVSAMAIGRVQGIIQTIADCFNIPMESYSEGEVKKFTLGKNSATKQEMIDAMEENMGFEPRKIKYIDEAVADALGVYYTATHKSETLRLFRRSMQTGRIC